MKNRVLCYRKIAVFLLKGSHFTQKGADNSIVFFLEGVWIFCSVLAKQQPSNTPSGKVTS